MASPYRPHPPPSELELTIVSAKHLKNVNWKTGDLKPYCVFWVDPTHRLSTKSDDSGSTRPVWNERFSLPLPSETAYPNYLTLEVLHSKPSETPKPLVGTLRISLADQIRDDLDRVRTFELIRPSGRPQGKIRVKIGIRERAFPPPPPYPHLPDYTFAPPPGYYYNPATPPPPPPPPRDYGHFSPPPYSPYPPPPSFYNGYYSSPPPPRPMYYGGAPSAPVDAYSPYDQRQRGMDGKGSGSGTGLAVGAVAGALGGLALDEGLKYEQDKTAEKVESDFSARGSHSSYRADY